MRLTVLLQRKLEILLCRGHRYDGIHGFTSCAQMPYANFPAAYMLILDEV